MCDAASTVSHLHTALSLHLSMQQRWMHASLCASGMAFGWTPQLLSSAHTTTSLHPSLPSRPLSSPSSLHPTLHTHRSPHTTAFRSITHQISSILPTYSIIPKNQPDPSKRRKVRVAMQMNFQNPTFRTSWTSVRVKSQNQIFVEET